MTKRRFRPGIVPTVFMLAGLALLLSLGSWQARRYQEQTALVELYHHQHDVLPPVTSLATTGTGVARIEALRFRRATLTGRLDTAHLQLLTARYMLGKLGYAVVAPMKVEGGPHASLLVHLGWASSEHIDAYLAELRAKPERTVSGRLQLADARVPGELPVGEHKGVKTWRHPNPSALARVVPGLDPDMMLQAGNQAVGAVIDPNKVPLDGYVYPVHPLPTKNIEYAATWFGLALTLVAVWVALSLKDRAAA